MRTLIANIIMSIFFGLVMFAKEVDFVLAQQQTIHIAQLDYSNFPPL